MDNRKKKSQVSKLAFIISLCLFTLSLTQHAYCTSKSCTGSLSALLAGWMGILAGSTACFPWLANPLLITAWMIRSKKPLLALVCSIAAFVLCLSFMFASVIMEDEAGNNYPIYGWKLGYWLWLASAGMMLVSNLLLRFSVSRRWTIA